MKNLLHCILLLIISVSGFSQTKNWRPVHNTQWGYLYQLPDKKSEKMGVLATEASILVLDSTQYFYKVRVSNNDVGFIEKQPIDTRIFARIHEDEPKEYFYRGESGQQSPHKYVRVSGLKARATPNLEGAIVKVLPINQYITIDYIPFNKEGWVYVGDFFREKPAFIQYKYLGDYLTFEDALADYQKAKDVKNQKIMVERLLEIGWTTSKIEDAQTALQLFKEFHQKNGSLANYPDLDFQIFMVQQMQNPMDYEQRAKFLSNADLHFEINGKKIYENKISETELKKLGLKKTLDCEGLAECSWAPEFCYASSDLKVVFEKDLEAKKLFATVSTMTFNKNQALILNNIKIDKNYSEWEFVKTFGKIIDISWNYSPHIYHIPTGDAGFLEITFRNGKAFAYTVIYLC